MLPWNYYGAFPCSFPYGGNDLYYQFSLCCQNDLLILCIMIEYKYRFAQKGEKP